MLYASAPLKRVELVFGFLLFVIGFSAGDSLLAAIQVDEPVESLELIEEVEVPEVEVPQADSAAPQVEATIADPVVGEAGSETIVIAEIEAPVAIPAQAQPKGSLEVPPPAALVTDSVAAVGLEKAEADDTVGDSIAKDAAKSSIADDPLSAQDISLESTNEAIENEKAKAATDPGALQGGTELVAGEDGGGAATIGGVTGKDAVITPKHIGWLWKFIWIALAIGFLLWLLSLITAKKSRAKETAKRSPNDQRLKPNAANTANTAQGQALAADSGESTSSGIGDLGTVFAGRPDAVDDLTKIGGIDAAAEKRLNQAGVWQYDQLRNMNPQQRANLQQKLNLPRIRWYSLSGLSSKADGAAGLDASKKSRLDAAVEGVAAPKFEDDLTQLPGVDAKIAGELNKQGIYNFKQLESLSSTQKRDFGRRYGLNFDKFSGGRFASSAAGAGQGGGSGAAESATSSSGSASAELGTLGAVAATGAAGIAGFAGQGSTPDRPSRSNGSVAGSEPAKTSPSASAFASASLNNSSFSNAESAVDKGKATNESDSKVGRTDPALGFVYTEAPRDVDDLTRLAGVDAAAEERLNEAGIFKFEQLENLSDQQLEELTKRCDLKGADLSDWRRCFYAWGRGINTSAEVDQVFENGSLNGLDLPQFAEGVFDGEKLSGLNEQVIFRGSNPEGWGAGNTGIEGVETSIKCDDIRSDINYLRLRRGDTGESVVVPMTKGQIFSNGDPATTGWNGSSEIFFGGRHVGAFAQHLPQEMETKFGQGGWGFGHRYDHNDRQEWGWSGRVIEPTTLEVSVGCVGKMPGTLVFRGSDPSIWNTPYSDQNGYAMPLDSVKHPVNFVRIMRRATGEAVIVRVDGNHILDEGFDPRCGWNGSSAEFSGGLHLGVYHCDLPQDFETRFEFGGWGFGHPYNDNDRQAWGWAGRQLPETVFEITLLESVPAYMQNELVS